jgi:Domain of unknown function (DUF4129)
MPIRFSRILPLLLVLSIVAVGHCLAGTEEQNASPPAAASGNAYADASSLAAELQRIGTTIKKEKANAANMAALRGKLPVQWELTTAERSYSLSAEPLRDLLRDAEKEKKLESMAAKATAAADWALELANQVNAYAEAQTHSAPSARPVLDRILSRRDFASVQGPTRLDLLRQRVVLRIENLIERLFRQVGRYPMGAKILFWLIVIAVVVWLALMLFRYWTKRATLEELQSLDSVAFVRTWQEWIHAAREAAERGDFREAVHSTYWAGICYLEDSGVVRKDRTRTPREYMRLVSSATQLAVSGRSTRESLSALTMILEQVWYGRRSASSQDFTNAMRNVEALGCQLQ